MFKILKVKGRSLTPDYHEGDFVLIRKVPFSTRRYREGDVVAFCHPDHGLMIKRLHAISENGTRLTVHGSHPFSVDSRSFGPIDAINVLGKVVWQIKNPTSRRSNPQSTVKDR